MSPEHITSARREMGLTYESLASLLHCSESAVRRWESPVGSKQHKNILGPAKVALCLLLNRHRRGLDLDIVSETKFRTMQKSD